MANTRKRKTAEPVTTEFEELPEVVKETKEEKPSTCKGVVKDCEKLNVRAQPSIDAKVVCRIDKGSVVEIDMTVADRDFHKVLTESGKTGYCMKKYISVKK